jgi:hypothetical protein
MYQMNCSTAHDDMTSFNVSSIDNCGDLGWNLCKLLGKGFLCKPSVF